MNNKISSTAEAWEDRQLGADEQFAEPVADKDLENRVDAALGMKMISIRVTERLIDDFKIIAAENGGIGYQTLMKQCLKRFADSELKRMARDIAADRQKSVATTATKTAHEHPRKRA